MANEAIEKAVDDLITKGRISRDLRNEYIQHFEANLQNDLLRGADYTNKTKELANARREAEQWINQERQKLQGDRQKLDSWYNGVQGELNEYERVKKEDLRKLAAYEQALKDYQIDGKPLLEEVVVPTKPSISANPTPTPARTMTTPTNFVTRDDLEKVVNNYTVINGKIDSIKAQHHRLYGEYLEEDLMSQYFSTGQDPEEYWRTKYGVEARRQEIETKQREAEYEKLKAQAREEIMREVTTDPNRIVGAPGLAPKGGLATHLERYMHSRALEHSQSTPNDQQRPEFVPPEKKADIPSTMERVSAASKMFYEHFDQYGNPTTERGRGLASKYNSG